MDTNLSLVWRRLEEGGSTGTMDMWLWMGGKMMKAIPVNQTFVCHMDKDRQKEGKEIETIDFGMCQEYCQHYQGTCSTDKNPVWGCFYEEDDYHQVFAGKKWHELDKSRT